MQLGSKLSWLIIEPSLLFHEETLVFPIRLNKNEKYIIFEILTFFQLLYCSVNDMDREYCKSPLK